MQKGLEEDLCICESGMYIGEGWHGGLTREEWTIKYNYTIQALEEFQTLKYE